MAQPMQPIKNTEVSCKCATKMPTSPEETYSVRLKGGGENLAATNGRSIVDYRMGTIVRVCKYKYIMDFPPKLHSGSRQHLPLLMQHIVVVTK